MSQNDKGWLYEEWAMLKNHSKWFVWFYLSAILIGVITFYMFKHNTVVTQQAFDSISHDLAKGQKLGQSQLVQCLLLFVRNSLVAFTIIGIGLLPFVVIPFLLLSYQTVIVGFVLSFGYQVGQDPLYALMFGVVPHGLFEFTAIVIASVLGTRLSLSKFQTLRRREYLQVIRLDPTDMKFFQTYLRIVVPLLLVAAFVETYITPVLLNI